MTYKLPHLLDRPGQPEALQWILESDKKYNILCGPTGFGKSPLAAACSIDYKTMAVVLHKSLQSANYKDQYNFDILYGKSNYPCLERPKQLSLAGIPAINLTAFDCGNPHCECPYQQQEHICMESMRTSLNYAKFLMSRPFVDTLELGYLFLDEAHNLPEIITEFVGCTIDWDNEFIQCNGGIKPNHLLGNEPGIRINHEEAMALFRQCARAIDENKPDRDINLKSWRKWKRLHQKILITNSILAGGSLPLTAKYHFKRLFDVADKVILMSATIKPSIAEKLGLKPNEFDYHQVPNPWPTPARLVYDLGGPAMNYSSSEADRQKNAELIASVLRLDKCGTIHVASKSGAYKLAERLYDIADEEQLPFEFFTPTEGIGTDNQLQEWYCNRQPGTYCIAWAFHEGVDLGDDDIGIMAKVPYASMGSKSSYERAKIKYDEGWYLEKTAYAIEQICGRSRRGRKEHYLPGAKQIYIVDSAWHRLKSLLSDDFRRSIRKYNGNE
jgi:Rad3-related DNA helicase